MLSLCTAHARDLVGKDPDSVASSAPPVALLAGMLNHGCQLPDAFKAASHTAQSIIAASPDGRDLALLESLETVRVLAR